MWAKIQETILYQIESDMRYIQFIKSKWQITPCTILSHFIGYSVCQCSGLNITVTHVLIINAEIFSLASFFCIQSVTPVKLFLNEFSSSFEHTH